ncbi:MAG TPA: hypothetical protein VGR00_03080 [Thermoanaerobaculia bacterium]|nr:hypothetical protein [Thermoanaerobaculia bacterium]
MRLKTSLIVYGWVSAALLSECPAAAQWMGPQFRVDSYTSGAHKAPAVAHDANGNFIVVWDGRGASGFGIYGQRFNRTGETLGSEFVVATAGQGPYYPTPLSPAVVSQPCSDFIVLWQPMGYVSQYFAPGPIMLRHFDSGGAPSGEPLNVSLLGAGIYATPSASRGPGGEFVAVWDTYAYVAGTGVGRRLDASGTPVGSTFSVADNPARSPSVAVGLNGDFFVTWWQGNDLNVWARRFAPSGEPLGTEFRVNEETGALAASVARDSRGDFIVAWLDFGRPEGRVVAQAYDPSGTAVGANVVVYAGDSVVAGPPSIASYPYGGFVLSWSTRSVDYSGSSILARRFQDLATPIGSEFVVSAVGGEAPRLSMDPSGNFVVVWERAYGIFARRYGSNVVVPDTSIRIEGPTAVCANSSGGTATTNSPGSHQWDWRLEPGGPSQRIAEATGDKYILRGTDFPGPGTYLLFCYTTPPCGSFAQESNELPITVVAEDGSPPAVFAPGAMTIPATLCE